MCRLPADAEEPEWGRAEGADFGSVTRTRSELSIICAEGRVPVDVKSERGWRVLGLDGPLPFDTVGVLVELIKPLAAAGIPIIAIGTYDTDYVMVRDDRLVEAQAALTSAGYASC